MFRWFFTLFLLAGSSYLLLGQDTDLEGPIDFDMRGGSLASCLDQLEALSDDFSLAYSDDMINPTIQVATRSWTGASLSEILDHLLSSAQITYQRIGTTIVFSKKRIIKYRLYGTVRDRDTRDYIPHAVLQSDGAVVRCDEFGRYSMIRESGSYSIICSMLGYASEEIQVDMTRDELLDIDLAFDNEIEAVVISTDSVERPSHHYEHYGYQYLRHLTQQTPGLGGTQDIMHTVRSLPGVQSGSGGIGGHYVRGSSNGENLYLLDGATIYYPYHAFGVTSIFDPAFIRDVQFYKSGQRAKYGSRASSVMDVHVRQGPRDRWTAEATGSLETASLMAGGPLGSKASLITYGRLSTKATIYDQIITNTILMDESPETNFSDLLVKYTHQLSHKHHLSATYYDGGDHIRSDFSRDIEDSLKEKFFSDLKWRSSAWSAAWRSVLSPRTLMTLRSTRSTYDTEYKDLSTILNNNDMMIDEYYTSVGSSISDLSLSAITDHQGRWGDVQIGWQTTRHLLTPHAEFLNSEELHEIYGEESFTIDEVDLVNVVQMEAYSNALHVEQKLSYGQWYGDFGMRVSLYNHENSRYYHLQPRVNISYPIAPKTQITASLSRMVQHIHLLPFSSVNLPRDVWYPSTKELRPESVWQYDVGWHHSTRRGIDIDTKVYLKRTSNLIAYNPPPGTENLEVVTDYFMQGSGTSHGLEVNASKKYGKLRGNIAYGYAKSTRDIPGFNRDRSYAFQFDRRHQVKVLGTYQVNSSLHFGSSLYLGSPYPKLFSEGTSLGFGIDQQDSSTQGTKNTQRANAVFRIDLSLQYQRSTGPLRHDLKVGCYNITDSPDPILHLYGASVDDSYPGFSVPVTPFVQYRISF